MKTYYITSLIILLTSFGYAQVTTQLNANFVNATIADDGFFFSNPQSTVPGYEAPMGSNINAIYSGSFWFGGKDKYDDLKLAAQRYRGFGSDYQAGPTSRHGVTFDTTALDYFGQTIWKVSQAEIENHIANYQSSTYIMPNDIANWPAHGDTNVGNGNGMLPFIAPFVDVDDDGMYVPQNGDYPCIKGDVAVFTILNDEKLHSGSLADPVGIELHCMFYQYTGIARLANVTFMDVEVVNMRARALFEAEASFFLDTDLGYYGDDYIGTDTERNMVYTYNADNFDESVSGIPGYSQSPPAIGIMVLSDELSSSRALVNSTTLPSGGPNTASEYFEIMRGNYLDGSPQLDGNNAPTKFAYTGDPNVSQSWSEYQIGATPGDRRLVASVSSGFMDVDFSLGAASRRTYSYAILFGKGANHLNSVTELQNTADFVQSHFDNMVSSCYDPQFLSVEELQEIEFSVYPNPNDGAFTVQLPKAEKAEASITDAQGRMVHSQTISNGLNTIQVSLQSGVYFVQVACGSTSNTERVVIR